MDGEAMAFGEDDPYKRGKRRGSYTIYYRRGNGDEHTERGGFYEGAQTDEGGRRSYMVSAGANRRDGGGGGFFGEPGGGGGEPRGFFGEGFRDVSPGSIYRFSPREIRELAIAVGALTLAFAIVFTFPSGLLFGNIVEEFDHVLFLRSLLISFIVVTTGFVLHELGHKFVAQRFGCWAEFRYSPMGLLIALGISAAFGFLFAAPGAVMVAGHVDRRRNGIISAAGPTVNLALGFAFLSVLFGGIIAANSSDHFAVGFMIQLGLMGAMVNFILGLFNMIPFPPLDGSKIVKWNIGVYGLLLAGLLAPFIWLIYTLYFGG